MNNLEFFGASFNQEIGAIKRVLEVLPESSLDYKPHERSRSARELAWVIASEMHGIAGILEHGDLVEHGHPAPATKAEILKHFEDGVAKVSSNLSQATTERWNTPGKFVVMGNTVATMPSQNLAWLMHNDLIHHRGQLSVYLRPMGAKVPSIYGPSGDDNGGN